MTPKEYEKSMDLAHLQISELRGALENMHFAYINKDGDFPHGFETDALKRFEEIKSTTPAHYTKKSEAIRAVVEAARTLINSDPKEIEKDFTALESSLDNLEKAEGV